NRKPRSALSFEVDDAEELTGISHQQVSRWAKGLSDPDAYRKRLYGVEYAAAMGLKSRGAASSTICSFRLTGSGLELLEFVNVLATFSFACVIIQRGLGKPDAQITLP